MSGISVSFLCLYRLVVPLILLAASVLRVNGISLGYVIILLAWAALPVNSHRPIAGVVLTVVGLVLSTVGLLGQAFFQIVLATDYKDDLDPPCTGIQRVWQQIGFNLMNHFDYQDYLHYLLPDVVVIVTCLVVLILGLKAIRQQNNQQSGDAGEGQQNNRQSQHSHGFIQKVIAVHSVIFFLSLFLAAVIRPSILTGIYLLLLLAIGMVWSTYHSFPVILHWSKLLTIIYAGLHLFVLYAYQFYAFQDEFSADNKWIKLLGLSAISDALDCSNNRPWEYSSGSDLDWRDYCNPGAVLILYLVSSYEIHLSQLIPDGSEPSNGDNTPTSRLDSWWLNPKSHRRSMDPMSTSDDESSETIELLVGGPPKTYDSLEPVPAKSTEETSATDDQGKISSEGTGKNGSSNVYSFYSALYEVLMDNSWHVTVIVMIAWSIIFVSWMTFALLVWASIIWIYFRSRTLCQYTSTVLVLYAMALIIGQYVYSLDGINDLIDNEEQVGFTSKWDNRLPIQIVFLWAFWINQRQFFREWKQKRPGSARKKSTFESIRQQLMPTPDSPEKDAFVRALEWIIMFVNEYWVLLCYAVFLLVSLTVEVSVMRYVYMAFFLLLLGFYQLSRALYKVIITPIWWVVAIYSVLFVWMLYLFQLNAVYNKLTDLAYSENETNRTLLSDIGLKQFSAGKLLENLLAPTLALIIIMLQLKYFHRKSRDPPPAEVESEEGLRRSAEGQASPDVKGASPVTIQRKADEAAVDLTVDGTGTTREEESSLTHKNLRWLFWSGLRHFIVHVSNLVLRFVELYLPTGLLLCIFIVALQQISAIEVFPIILLCVFIVTGKGQKLFYFLLMLWTSLTITAKMLYQLQFVKPNKQHYNCSYNGQVKLVNGLELAKWFGLQKLDDNTSVFSYIEGYIVIVVLIALVISADRYQRDRARKNAELPEKYALFLQVTRVDADIKLISAAKYLINHFFEVFGMQLCFLTFGIVAAVRLDAYGLLYCLILALLLVVSETHRRRLWPVVVIIVAICISVQYTLLVGAPPTLCYFSKHDYPWFPMIDNNKTGLLGWFYLPVFKGISWKQEELLGSNKNYLMPQDEWFLVGDFFLLVLVGWQWGVYQWLESRRTPVKAASQEPGEIYKPPDFTFPDPKGPWQKLWLDYLKIVIFKYGFWFTVLMIFLTGVNRISLFCLGYIIFAFIFLWFGQGQLTFGKERLHKWWNALLCYNVFVIIFKVALQLGACAYSVHMPCAMVKLFNIVCIHKHQYQHHLHVEIKTCSSGGIPDTTGIALDVTALGFILVQRYLFNTQYFVHVQNEMQWYSSNLKLGASMVKQATRYSRKKLKRTDEERQKEIQEHVDKLRQDHRMHQFLYAGTKPVEGILEPTEVPSPPDTDVDPILAAEIDKESKSLESESAIPKETDVDQSSDLSTLQKIKLGFLEVLEELTVWLQRISSSYRAVTLTLEDTRKKKEEERRHGLQDTPLQELDEHVDEPIFKADENPESLIDKFLLSDESPDDAERAHVLQEKLKEGLASITVHFRKLFRALWYAIVARTDLICYFVIIINFTVTGSALSLPLPLMVFFWGLLSVPRPSKTFWIVLELYVMLIIIIRYICQSTLIPLKDADEGEEDRNLRWPAYIGIQQVSNFTSRSMADFVVLWAVSVHIAKLQLRGLWLSTREQTAIDGHRELSPFMDDEEDSADDHEDDDDDNDNNGDDTVAKNGSSSVAKTPKKPNICKRLFWPMYRFFYRAISRKHSPGWRDYYTLMVFFDVLCFIITIFGWSYFGEANNENVASYIQQNYIPVPFIAMLIIQFILILVDRLLYRSGWELGKLVMHIGVVTVVHIWVFLVLPLVTRRSFVGNSVVQTWYFFKCIYMGVSAAQIASGFPPRRSGNFLMNTKKYPTVRGRVFQVLFMVPFLTELRELMDWCVASTTLDLILWLKVQDVWYEMFLVKCRRKREERNPRTLGDRQPPITKFILGSLLITALVIILWFPLLWISLLNSSSVPNRPIEVSVELKVGGYEPLFSFTAQEQSLMSLTSDQYNFLKSKFTTSDQKFVFARYDQEDITRTLIPSTSSSQWTISPRARVLLAETLENKSIPIVNMDFLWSLTRNPPTGFVSQVVSGSHNIQLPPDHHVRTMIAKMLRNVPVSNHSVSNLFPVFISGPANERSEQMYEFQIPSEQNALAECSLFLESNKTEYGDIEWWKVNQTSPHVINVSGEMKGYLEFIIFNEPVTPPKFSFLAGSSVIGLYLSIVLVIGQFLKGFTKDISHKIIYQDVPEPVDVIQLCEDIFLVRDLGKEGLQLEELLVGKLFFLYRSPERLIEWTRIKQRENE